jgi:hypothetical protein
MEELWPGGPLHQHDKIPVEDFFVAATKASCIQRRCFWSVQGPPQVSSEASLVVQRPTTQHLTPLKLETCLRSKATNNPNQQPKGEHQEALS